MPDLDKLSVMPVIYGQEIQQWHPRKVFGRLKDQLPKQYTERILTLRDVMTLVDRSDPATIRRWVKSGKLKTVKIPMHRKGHVLPNRFEYRFSLQDVSDAICNIRRNYHGTDHSVWTSQEIELLQQGYYLSSRSRKSAIIKRSRIGFDKIKLHMLKE